MVLHDSMLFPVRTAVTASLARPEAGDEGKFVALIRVLQERDPELRSRVVQVMGAHSGAGVTTVAQGIASVAAEIAGARVLLCDASPDRAALQAMQISQMPPTLSEMMAAGSDLSPAIVPVRGHKIALCALAGHDWSHRFAVNTLAYRSALGTLRRHFDLILIDAPPASESVIGPAIARDSDGVILVIEAESTQWSSAREAQRAIVEQGGMVIGAIFNKRRQHLPRSLRRWFQPGD